MQGLRPFPIQWLLVSRVPKIHIILLYQPENYETI